LPAINFWLTDERQANPGARIFKGTANDSPSPGEKRYLTWEHIFMISNERPSPFKGLPQMQPRPPVHEETLKFEQVEIEHKNFVFTLKENLRGRFLRIT
jgi:hypothetical protein